jgi:hypothetical protein
MALAYVCLYLSYRESLEPYSMEERGRLVTAMMDYQATGEIPTFPGNERFLWPTLRSQIERDIQGYEEKCAKNRENGAKGGRPKKQTVSAETEGFSEKPKKPKEKEKEKKKEKEKENKNETPSEREIAFRRFWEAYPRKVGKEAARRAFAKVKVDVSLLLHAVQEQRQSEQWTKDGGKYIPNPATWLNQGRWEDKLPGSTADRNRIRTPEEYLAGIEEDYA